MIRIIIRLSRIIIKRAEQKGAGQAFKQKPLFLIIQGV